MINIKELRIGNYVLYRENKAEISGISLDHISARTFYREAKTQTSVENTPLAIEYCNPILLTEKLLLKCGFEKHQFGDAFIFYNPLLELDAHFRLKGVDYNIQVKYLHQLQNLYFFLTGEELEVNL